jgi:hypothetical protein
MVRDRDAARAEHVMQALSTMSDVERVRQYQKLIELELLKMGHVRRRRKEAPPVSCRRDDARDC